MSLLSNVQKIGLPVSSRYVARAIARRADLFRDAGQFRDAALLYEEALRFAPRHAGIQIQCGHMLKETGNYDDAERHYRLAQALRPRDADLALQFGHLYKTAGRPADAEAAYRTALELKPGWEEPARELSNIATTKCEAQNISDRPSFAGSARISYPASLVRSHAVLPELTPVPPHQSLVAHSEGLEIRHLGRWERTFWGKKSVLRGVESIRGFCIASIPVSGVQILLNGESVHRATIEAGYPLKHEKERPELRKYPFNLWIDVSSRTPGRYQLEVRATDVRGRSRKHHFDIVIEEPLLETDFPETDGLVSIDPSSGRSLDEQINGRPSMARPGRRALFPNAPQTILVQRVDQLGDMVVSVPAIRRIRTLFPEAKLVGLLSRANVELAHSLELFDDIIATEFPEDPTSRKRIMSIEAQIELGETLSRYHFDIAIDLSENSWSRRLLILSRAKFLYGFRTEDDLSILHADVAGNTHDRIDGMEIVPHTNKLMGMVEWLGAMARSEPNIAPRSSPADKLGSYIPDTSQRFALFHDGARLSFSRWPGYLELAARVIRDTELAVVMITDHPDLVDKVPTDLSASGRFRLIAERLPFDDFDQLVANCDVFVGNDSGPKHLASFRGAKVVSIHMARNNWNEWGQESGGIILSRKVPCAGCVIHHDPEECGKGFPCIRLISVDEVFQSVRTVLASDLKPWSSPS